MTNLVHCQLGRRPYREIWELQKALQQELIRGKRESTSPALPHLALQVEHDPVYTIGKSGDEANLLLSEEALANLGATFERVGRGGDITFHGPGQLVLYPILDLDRIFTDLSRYLRSLESAVIKTIGTYGIVGTRIAGKTGVWIEADEHGPDRKICAMGIRCSRWVTMHGLALNIATDLGYFDKIIPCGLRDSSVTSMNRELGREVDGDEVDGDEVGTLLVSNLADELGLSAEHLDGTNTSAYLDAFLARATTN